MADPTLPAPERNIKKPRKRNPARLFFIICIVAFALAFGITARFAALPSAALARAAGRELNSIFAPPVRIGEARLEPGNLAAILRDVRVGSDPDKPDLHIETTRVEVEFVAGGGVRVKRIILSDCELAANSLGRLFKSGSGAQRPADIPQLLLLRAKIRVDVPGVGEIEFTDLSAAATPREGAELSIDGTARTPVRGQVRVGGNINLNSGALDVRAETMAPVELSAISEISTKTGGTISEEIEYWRRQFLPEGRVTFFARIARDHENSPLKTSAEVEADGIRLRGPEVVIDGKKVSFHEIVATDFTIRGRLQPDGTAQLSAGGRVLGGAMMQILCEAKVDPATGDLQQMEAGASVRELLLGPHVQTILDSIDDGVADVVRGLHPAGPVDLAAGARFRRGDAPGGAPPGSIALGSGGASLDFSANIDFTSRTTVTFLGLPNRDNSVDASFPIPLRELTGRISVRPGNIQISGVRGSLGAGRLEASGAVTGSGLVGIDLFVRGAEIPVDAGLERAVKGIPQDESIIPLLQQDPQWADPVAKTWKPVGLPDGPETLQLFDLRGKINFDLDIYRNEGERPANVVVRARSDRSISGTFRDIPIPIDGLDGSVTFHRGLAKFAFDGAARGGRVRVEGSVDGRRGVDGREPTRNGLRIRVTAKDFNLDPGIAPAFHSSMEDLGDFIQEIEPSGICNFEYRGERPVDSADTAPESYILLQSRDTLVRRVPNLRVPVEGVAGAIKVFVSKNEEGKSNLRAWMDSIRAQYFGRPVFLSGIFTKVGGEDPALDLTATGSDLPLRNDLLEQVLRGSSPRAADAVARYEFGGRFDASVVRRSNAFVNTTDLSASVREGGLRGPGLPGPVDGVAGDLQIFTDGTVQSRHLAGVLNGVPAAVDEFRLDPVAVPGGVVISGTVNGSKPVDVFDSIERVVPSARKWMDRIQCVLKAIPDKLAFQLTIPPEGSARFSASGGFIADGGSVLAPTTIGNIRGPAQLEKFIFNGDLPAGSMFEMVVRPEGAALDLFGAPMTDIRGRITITPESLRVSGFDALLTGGRVTKSKAADASDELLSLYFTETPPRFELGVHVKDADLAEIFKYLPTKIENVRGRMRFDTILKGSGFDYRSYEGGGKIVINDASLFDVPGFKAVYDGLRMQQKPVFKEMTGDFSFARGLMNFRKLEFLSDELELLGDGWLSFDSQMSMTFLPRKFYNNIPIVGSLINALQDRILDVYVYGTIDRPQYKVNTFLSKKVTTLKEVITPLPELDLGTHF